MSLVICNAGQEARGGNAEIEQQLTDFHCNFLAGTDYAEKIELPLIRRHDYFLSKLVIQVHDSLALVIDLNELDVCLMATEYGRLVKPGTDELDMVALSAGDGSDSGALAWFSVPLFPERGLDAYHFERASVARKAFAVYGMPRSRPVEPAILVEDAHGSVAISSLVGPVSEQYAVILGKIEEDACDPAAGELYLKLLNAMLERRVGIFTYRRRMELAFGPQILSLQMTVPRAWGLSAIGVLGGASSLDGVMVSRALSQPDYWLWSYLYGELSEANFQDLVKTLARECYQENHPGAAAVPEGALADFSHRFEHELDAYRMIRQLMMRYGGGNDQGSMEEPSTVSYRQLLEGAQDPHFHLPESYLQARHRHPRRRGQGGDSFRLGGGIGGRRDQRRDQRDDDSVGPDAQGDRRGALSSARAATGASALILPSGVVMRAKGRGRLGAGALELHFHNTTSKTMIVKIPVGTEFISESSLEQNMAIY